MRDDAEARGVNLVGGDLRPGRMARPRSTQNTPRVSGGRVTKPNSGTKGKGKPDIMDTPTKSGKTIGESIMDPIDVASEEELFFVKLENGGEDKSVDLVDSEVTLKDEPIDQMVVVAGGDQPYQEYDPEDTWA
jgi:hypothetical protein